MYERPYLLKRSQNGSPFGILCRRIGSDGGVSEQIQFTKKRGREGRKEQIGRKVTDGDGERETVLKSPAPVQKLDSPRLDDGCTGARLPGKDYTTKS